MTYLIDTHVLIWHLLGHPSLERYIIEEIQDPSNIVFVSKVSLWEIAIKASLGKLNIGVSFPELEDFLIKKKFLLLEFNSLDLQALSTLPFPHRDPFDRLLVCQAINRNLQIITDDNKFKLYPVQLFSR